jgi:hypothetical protein
MEITHLDDKDGVLEEEDEGSVADKNNLIL